MTISSDVQDVTHNTDGSTVVFPVTFYFLEDKDLIVEKIDANDGVTALLLGTDYSVSGAGLVSGGSVTTFATYPVGYRLHVYRSVPVTQETQYQQNDPFPAKATEKALDKLTMIAQQVSAAAVNAIRYPLAEYGTDGTLPKRTDRAQKILAFDEAGQQTFLPLPASVGAGDLKNESWTDGVDYTSGASTSVSLSRAYGTKANLGAVVMSGVAQDPNSYSLSNGGTTLQFDAPIPAGVSRIWCVGGTTLSIYVPPDNTVTDAKVAAGAAISATKLAFRRNVLGAVRRTLDDIFDDDVSVKDFGAIGDGNSHPLSDFYATLAAAQVDYPIATSLTNQIDDIAINTAILYARDVKASVRIPYGIFLVRQITVYTDTVLRGEGRNATVLKQVVGSNTDLIYGANSNANWGSATPSNIVNGCTLAGMTLDGQWNNGAGNTVGTGIAIYGTRPIWVDLFVKNTAEHGIRSEYNPTSSIGADAFTMEGELRNIRIDTCGKRGFWFNGPNDTVMDSLIAVDAGQAANNTWDAFYFDQYAVARCYGLHAWNRHLSQRHRFALNLQPGSQCEFVDCQFEGAYSANVQIQSQRNVFSDSCAYFAPWNGVNMYMGGPGCTLNVIKGKFDGPGLGRPPCAGIVFASDPSEFVGGNLIDIVAIEQQAGIFVFNYSGGDNSIRVRGYQSAGGTYQGSPHPTDVLEVYNSGNALALNSSPTRSAAWVVFSVSGGAVTINASHNVSGVTRAAAGQYTVTFIKPLKPFAHVEGSCDYGQVVGKGVRFVRPYGNTSNTQDIHFRSDDGTYGDPNMASVGFIDL
ncbi:glycosyl hydrolase family 28-related protein [Burkholderia dolosa]|uniref:glycosyl hydrolase family 28-related protein n=1 Tax=Burkholderia dolosa TaxID=152500 RepID=UPI0027D331D7|nr:glycosyl hydrolase family 28-related protein [Burkholderia dolosa]